MLSGVGGERSLRGAGGTQRRDLQPGLALVLGGPLGAAHAGQLGVAGGRAVARRGGAARGREVPLVATQGK